MHAPTKVAIATSICVLVAWLAIVPGALSTALGQGVVVRRAVTVAPSAPPTGSMTISDAATARAVQAAPAPAAAVGAEAGQENAEAKKAERLNKINQLPFDRRPSAILQAWATPEGEEEAEKARAEAKANAGKPKPELPRDIFAGEPPIGTPKVDPFDAALKDFQRSVTLGDWPAVRSQLRSLPEEEGKALYQHLLEALPNVAGMPMMPNNMPPGMMMNPNLMQFGEKSAFTNADVVELARCAPRGLGDDRIEALGRILGLSLERGNTVEDFVARAKAEAEKPAGEAALTRRQAAKLLVAANRMIEAGAFLPSPEGAEAENDREALNLLSRHYLALYAKEKMAAHLERAWTVTQAVLASGEVDKKDKDEALTRAVELAPKVRAELGETWLESSFTDRPQRGMEIIAAIGSASSRGLQAQPFNPDGRAKALELQKTAVEALLKAAPARADEWRESLNLLAGAWLAEAEFSNQYDTSTSLGPRMQRDSWGNLYFLNNEFGGPNMMPQNPNMPRPVPVGEILKARPDDAWVGRLDDAIRPRYSSLFSRLYLKVGEDATAFPYIERLAPAHPEQARELAEEFLRVWTRNHDPNAARSYTNPYMFMYGFERRAESIPLTRSKQERNIKELSDWVARLRKLPIAELDETLLTGAFTACHSTAEVYRLEAIEEVFGSVDALKPETLADLIQKMRGNLAGLWRQPAVQEQAKTRRKEKDIRAEVLRGYEMSRAVIDRALEKHPDQWSLVLARAAILHDENNYRKELDPSSDFAGRRRQALGEFRRAAALYAAKVPDLKEEEESIEPFAIWFYAGLGACDLGAIVEKTLPDPRQPALIREAIAALPGESAKRHMDKFANALFTRMSGLNPAVKFRYLRAGFDIVGDHEQAHEARKVYDYYNDLVTEITLDAALDGPAVVGTDRPFGLFVNLRHTREIERESGGFGRYLQNQNTGGGFFFYNYGRPLENYRDKFEEAAREALKEHFEVLSVTFQDEKVNSRATPEYGWRYTPYAYVLLKARSPKVDKVPPLRLDLDFLDTSGYVILPVESPTLPIDAATETLPTRPYQHLKVAQTLDERQAKDGKLILEVKASAQGLVPDLDEVLDVGSEGFEVVKTEDQGLSVARFDPDAEENVVLSERTWLVTFQAKEGLAELPKSFHFAPAKIEAEEMLHQRYVDADLAEVGEVVDLEQKYGEPSRAWLWWALGGLAALVVAALLAWRLWPRGEVVESERFRIPEPLTPFTVLALLRDVLQHGGLNEAKRRELAESIQYLERHYFAAPAPDEPDLRRIAETWVRGWA
jgi:hypothetical protein